MASLRQLRRRMRTIDSIHEITKAMETIATFRFKRAEARFTKAKPFFSEMERLVTALCTASAENITDPLFTVRKIRRKALLVVTADRGLCGAYNTNLIRATGAWLKENEGTEVFLVPVGKVGCRICKKKNMPMLASYVEKGDAGRALAARITADLKEAFLKETVDSVEILYAVYRGGQAHTERIPFLGLNYLLRDPAYGGIQVADYIYEPDLNGVFFPLLGRYLEAKIYVTLLESLTSEQAARRAAMKLATENGEEMMDTLTLLRNKTRQAAITNEISEIVSGANVIV